MINISERWPPKHKQVIDVIDYLNEKYPIENSKIEFRYEPLGHYYFMDGIAYGLISSTGNTAKIRIAVRDRLIRAIAKTTAHEYMHCIQFIQRELRIDGRNRAKLEREACKFADEILIRLWKERGLFCPSTL